MCKYSNVLSKPALIGRAASLTFITTRCVTPQERSLKGCPQVMRFRDLVCELDLVSSLKIALTLCVSIQLRGQKVFLVAMAEGSHPFPSRTRKLSPLAPMVLPWRRGGRVGNCQVLVQSPRLTPRALFIFPGSTLKSKQALAPLGAVLPLQVGACSHLSWEQALSAVRGCRAPTSAWSNPSQRDRLLSSDDARGDLPRVPPLVSRLCGRGDRCRPGSAGSTEQGIWLSAA